MTDLSSIFRPRTPTPGSGTSPPVYTPYARLTQSQSHSTGSGIYSTLRQKPSTEQFTVSSEAKKLITYDNLQQEASWFNAQNLLECLVKIFMAGFAIAYLYGRENLEFNTGLSLFVFVFLLLGTSHHIFGGGAVQLWALCSLFGTALVLLNQIFLHVLARLSTHVAASLFDTYWGLLPALYLTALTAIVFHSMPLLACPLPRSALHNILNYPRSLWQLLQVIYQLKVTISQVYCGMLMCTFVAVLSWTYSQDQLYRMEEIMAHLLHPYVLLGQVVSFLWVLVLMHVVTGLLSGTVMQVAIGVLYNAKNVDTKLPIMLELLRLTKTNSVTKSKLNFLKQALQPLGKVFVSSFKVADVENKLSRYELENVYRHSLLWVTDLLAANPEALSTKITLSKFYHSYFDIFREFAESEIKNTHACLYELINDLQTLTAMKAKPKSITTDLFYWAKILKKQMLVWHRAVECCRMLQIVDQVLQIVQDSGVEEQMQASSSMVRELNQIRHSTAKLKDNNKVNEIIRGKMQQYFNKVSRVLQN